MITSMKTAKVKLITTVEDVTYRSGDNALEILCVMPANKPCYFLVQDTGSEAWLEIGALEVERAIFDQDFMLNTKSGLFGL